MSAATKAAPACATISGYRWPLLGASITGSLLCGMVSSQKWTGINSKSRSFGR